MVDGSRLTPTGVAAILAWCRQEHVRCVYFLAESNDSQTIRLAEQNGFEFQDVRITFELGSTDWKTFELPASGISIRAGRLDDIPALRQIAATAYRDARFYFDRRFSHPQCDLLYAGWLESICRAGAENVLIAERGRRVVGYLCCGSDGSGAGRIGLTGVEAANRGQGVGRHLVVDALRWFQKRGIEQPTVITQARNVRAQRLYQRCGFVTQAVHLWYHRWFGE
jgi:ribosomal protein S18 acetylase RimI-like enzyme